MNSNINENAINAIREKYLRGNKAKLTMAKIATAAMIIIALMFSHQFLPETATRNAEKIRVHDKDGILSDATINAINARASSQPEIVVAVEKDSGSNRDLAKRAEKLFKDYKLNDNGILFIVSVREKTDTNNVVEEWVEKNIVERFAGGRHSHSYFIGRNIEYSFRNEIDGIIADNFSASYEEGNYNAAVLDTYNAFLEYFGYSDAGMSEPAGNSAAEAGVTTTYATGIRFTLGVVAILGAALILVGMFTGSRKNRAVRQVYKSSSWFSKTLGFENFFGEKTEKSGKK
jgi:uncharacterized membrane protein YgcG